ncbi:MAG: hypothetical protein OXC26_01595 [Albidovulum sp.]|nr:hypothetical protein [Albidovulum sp.]
MPPIPSRALVAIGALGPGKVQLIRAKGANSRRFIGWIWIALMVQVAVSGLSIREIRTFGSYNPIHILSFVPLISLALGGSPSAAEESMLAG